MLKLRRTPEGEVKHFTYNFDQFGDVEGCIAYDIAGLPQGSKIYIHSAYEELHIKEHPWFTWRTIARVVVGGFNTEVQDFQWVDPAVFTLSRTGFVSIVLPGELLDLVLISIEGPTVTTEEIVPI